MKYEEYLDKFCSDETLWKETGDTYKLNFTLWIRLKLWLLRLKGYLVRVEVDYHYDSVYPEKRKVQGQGFGFVRIHKYKPKKDISIGLEIEKGNISE